MQGVTSPEWSKFLGAVKVTNAALGDPELVWYRGHPDVDHYPAGQSSALQEWPRKGTLSIQLQKFSDRIFKRRASEWETLFEMQHYRVSTRLLDWTESFGVALFFAAYYNKSRGSGKVGGVIYKLTIPK